MALFDSSERSWPITLIARSKDCPGRYREWKPPKDGWFCKETNKKCSENICPYRADEESG